MVAQEPLQYKFWLPLHIDRLVLEYGINGIKKEKGDTGNGTWRNALNRLRDFRDFILNS